MPNTKRAKRWSGHVTKTSNALALDAGAFSLDDPKAIARSLKRSAETEPARKVLEQAKEELRELYGRR